MTMINFRRVRSLTLIGACIAAAVCANSGMAATPTNPNDGPPFCKHGVERTPHPQYEVSNKIMVSPPVRELTLAAGRRASRCIGISNRTARPLELNLRMVDIEPSADAESVLTVTKNFKYGTSSWIHPIVSSIELAPGEDVLIPYSIDVPGDASAGSNYGGIEVSGHNNAKAGLGVASSLVSQVLITVPGQVIHKGRIVTTKSPRLIEHGSFAAFKFEYANDGTATDHVSGRVTIVSSISGKKVDVERYDAGRVLRGGNRTFSTLWTSPPWIGRFEPTLTVTTDEGVKTVNLPAIWVVPPTLYWVSLLILVLIASIYWFWSRRRMRRWLLEDELDADEYDIDDAI